MKSNEKIKIQIHQELLKVIHRQRLRSRDLERLWDVPQPRVSQIMNGKIEKMTIDKLLSYADLLGVKAKKLVFTREKKCDP